MPLLLALLLLFPLAGAAVNALAGRRLSGRGVEWTACGAVLASGVMAVWMFVLAGGRTLLVDYGVWFSAGELAVRLGLRYDPMAALMTLMVTLVALIIHVYSAAFMAQDPDRPRFFAFLNLFVFSMLLVTLADDLAFFYLGWEGMGLCSYALIGFWHHDPANADAGRKAFVVTRLGDVGLGLALASMFWYFHDLSLTHILAQTDGLSPALATFWGLLLLWAALGKSAQLPLSVWLPDAMAGPSPVSALIHAATMVTAGAYLLMRLLPLLLPAPLVLGLIALIGAATTLYGALGALGQHDIKRVLAYSTISQMGYLFLAVGAGDLVGGMFHLISHAFFKSLLFLTAGTVIVAMHEEHDIFRMGDLRRRLPGVARLFLIGALCLSAFPLLGGFFSKDRILLATWLHPGGLYLFSWALGMAAALLTPLYVFRVYYVAFAPGQAAPESPEPRPVPRIMNTVLWPLAILALGDGLLNLPMGPGKNLLSHFLASVPAARPELDASVALEWAMGLFSAAGVLASIWLAHRLYAPGRGRAHVDHGREWLAQGLYLDRFALRWLARPYRQAADYLWAQWERGGLDLALMSLGQGASLGGRGLGRWHNGRLGNYLASLLAGLGLVLGLLALVWLVKGGQA